MIMITGKIICVVGECILTVCKIIEQWCVETELFVKLNKTHLKFKSLTIYAKLLTLKKYLGWKTEEGGPKISRK